MADANNYIDHFKYGNSSSGERFEIGYQLIRNLAYLISDNYRVLFCIVGAIALAIKFKAIQTISPFVYGSLLVYLSYFFVLHDMIQIRAGIASGVGLFAVKYIAERDLKRFLIACAIAICFHSSMMIFLPLWFLPYLKQENNIIWFASIPICYILALSGYTITKFIDIIPIDTIQNSWRMYQYQLRDSVSENVGLFNYLILTRVCICYFLLFYTKHIEVSFRHAYLWIYIYVISICMYALFSNTTIIAIRLNQILQVVEIMIIPLIVYTFKDKRIGKIAVITIALSLLCIIIRYNKYLL